MFELKFKTLLIKLITIIFAFLIFLLLPVLIVLSIPVFILRWIIGKIGKFLNPNLDKIVSARGSLIAAGDRWKITPKLNVLIQFEIEGNLDVDKSRESFRERVIEAKLPNGELLYPELKQVLIKFLGFYFWARDPKFDLKNHIRFCDKKNPGEKWSSEEIKYLREEKVEMVWDPKKPLWEILIINNYYESKEDEKPHSILLLTFHHSLGDGYSWMNLITRNMCESKEELRNAKPDYKKSGIIGKVLGVLGLPVALPWFIAEMVLMGKINLPWRLKAKQLKVGKMFQDSTERISVKRIKEIKYYYKVNFSSVIYAIMSGAFRDILIQKGDNVSLPEGIPCLSSYPLPGHSEKLRNFLTGVTLNLPIGEPDAIKRLLACSKDYERLKRSMEPGLLSIVMKFIGCHFPWFIKLVAANQSATVGVTNFPGGVNYLYFCGMKAVEITFMGGVVCEAISVCALTYGENLRIIPVVDAQAMNREDLAEMTKLIEKHLDILYKSMT